MRKACMAGIGVLIGISMLAGCGKSLNADTDTVYVQKNGTVLTVDVETLDKDYYDETELKDYVTDAVSAYTEEHGKNTVKLEGLSVKDSTATLKMKYKTPEDYTGFNGIELYEGKVVKALAAGYDFNTDFVSVEDGKVTGTATKEEIYSGDDLKAVIIKANRDVKVDGTICYVSTENVKLTGADSVSIRDGYSLNSDNVSDENDSGGTENVGGSTEISDTDVNDDTAYVKDDGTFETDVYTYIIYK